MKYTSKYSPNKKVSPAQYICELVCENRASSLNLDLPVRFWNRPEWSNFFKFQLKKANEYVDKYEPAILIKIIKEKNIFSLNANWIEPIFIQETELAKQQQEEPIEHTRVVDSKGMKRKKKDFGKLDG